MLNWQAALEAVIQHPLFAVGITLGAFQLAQALYAKTRLMLFQPLLVSVAILVGILLLLGMDYQLYRHNTQLLTLLLGPATVALAVVAFILYRGVYQTG